MYGDCMYYSYHNVILNKIKEGKLVKYEYKDRYKNISPVLILYFNDGSIYPIREYAWFKYNKYLNEVENNK